MQVGLVALYVNQQTQSSPPDGQHTSTPAFDVTTSHSTDETTSHPTKQPEDGCQVVGYKLPKGFA